MRPVRRHDLAPVKAIIFLPARVLPQPEQPHGVLLEDQGPRLVLDEAWTPYKLKDGKDNGYGWAIGKLRGRRVIEHGRGIFGFVTHALRIPESRVYVAVLGNLDRPKLGPNYLAKKIAAHVLGDPFPERTAVRWTRSSSSATQASSR